MSDDIGLGQFLRRYPRMALRPTREQPILLRGHFDFTADCSGLGVLSDSFELQIEVPREFPGAVPRVIETGGRIQRTPDNHVNADGSLCLGSPLRLLRELKRSPTLFGFAAGCIVPYLYAVSGKIKHGGALVIGELPHGRAGELSDYAVLFGLNDSEQALAALRCLGMKKRRANKQPCPCGCGRRLGVCELNRRLAPYRRLASRRWYRQLHGDTASR